MEEGEEYILECYAIYSGDPGWAPVMEWWDSNGFIETINNSSAGIMHFLVQVVATPEQDGIVYTAKTHFQEYQGELPPDMATNIPDYFDIYEYDALIVECKYASFFLVINVYATWNCAVPQVHVYCCMLCLW